MFGLIVIIVMNLINQVHILNEVCILFCANVFGKSMNPFLLLFIDKIVGQTGLFSLDVSSSLREGKTLN